MPLARSRAALLLQPQVEVLGGVIAVLRRRPRDRPVRGCEEVRVSQAKHCERQPCEARAGVLGTGAPPEKFEAAGGRIVGLEVLDCRR
eukprot:scaffold19298_cov62-Phaeocystis_antarctica.AAC.7